ncbi:AGAP003763-PA-like protein [Anopheles sinensis]|uniref:AGAP003763-PA-like protein n=1 Tax=Anopheles sinensis TaxID=74873 RepID=A0A084VUJ9_ANOSI|nr:AGAP003763-PA-like protein [Anopheles sinensis]
MDHRVDEALVPAWLDDNFFRTVIRKFTHDEGTELCHGCKLRPGTKPGEHFASVMYRTTIHYRSSKGKEAALDRADTIVDTMFVDYQMCCWSSQTVDLFYLTYMIPEQSVKECHRDQIIYSYHREFSRILQRLEYGGRIPSLIDLQTECFEMEPLVQLFHYIVFSAFRYIDLSTVDAEAFFLGRIENPALAKEEFQRVMKEEMKRFLYQGIIS